MELEDRQLRNHIQDITDQNELLEFRILELEVKKKAVGQKQPGRLTSCPLCPDETVFSSGEGAPLARPSFSTTLFPRRPQSSPNLL